jgi:hypothetical protein
MYADGKNPDLRVSDAERDSIVTELSQHFQDGRLDQGEFGQRVSGALTARTRGELDQLTTDLPRPALAGPGAAVAPARYGPPRALALVPLLFAAAIVASAVTGGWHHGWAGGWPAAPFGFLWLVVPVLIIRARARGGRRQWR